MEGRAKRLRPRSKQADLAQRGLLPPQTKRGALGAKPRAEPGGVTGVKGSSQTDNQGALGALRFRQPGAQSKTMRSAGRWHAGPFRRGVQPGAIRGAEPARRAQTRAPVRANKTDTPNEGWEVASSIKIKNGHQ